MDTKLYIVSAWHQDCDPAFARVVAYDPGVAERILAELIDVEVGLCHDLGVPADDICVSGPWPYDEGLTKEEADELATSGYVVVE